MRQDAGQPHTNKEQFALRRVRRTVNYFVSIGEHPNQSTFAEVAGIAYATTFPSIRQAIDDALVEIGAHLTYGSSRPLITSAHPNRFATARSSLAG
jgi:hypothetical protein